MKVGGGPCFSLLTPSVCVRHGAMGWPASVIMAFLGHTLSFFETIIIVDDNTIVLHKIEL